MPPSSARPTVFDGVTYHHRRCAYERCDNRFKTRRSKQVYCCYDCGRLAAHARLQQRQRDSVALSIKTVTDELNREHARERAADRVAYAQQLADLATAHAGALADARRVGYDEGYAAALRLQRVRTTGAAPQLPAAGHAGTTVSIFSGRTALPPTSARGTPVALTSANVPSSLG